MKPEPHYFDQELSWLAFNERVLAQSFNENCPLLERLKYIAITAKNLDEFYMVRVASLRNKKDAGIEVVSHDGLNLSDLIKVINERALKLLQNQQLQLKALMNELRSQNVSIVQANELSRSEENWLRKYFEHNLLPVLTPLALDPAHPFPFIPNMGLTIALELSGIDKKEMKVLIPIPSLISRFIPLPGNTGRYILTEDVILLCMKDLFPDFEINSHGCFRILRHNELDFNDDSEDFVRHFEVALKKRKRNAVILLTIDGDMPHRLQRFILKNLNLESGDVITVDGILGLDAFEQLLDLPIPDLRYTIFKERFPERIREFGGNIFEAISHKDLVVHHPYESFDVVVQFLKHAARDPDVVSIKLTLYRTSRNSPIVAALIEAAENGKSVTAVVEIKAELDEQANLQWAHELERAGVMVIYGIFGSVTHGKMSLVTRKERDNLQIYTHLATGNYHQVTAQIYDDLSLFTADPEIGEEASKVFNYITGYALPKTLKKLSFAPITLRSTLEDLIRNEIDAAKKGEPAFIWVKVNSFGDKRMIDLLYEASSAGVSIDLIVRGICSLVPGIKGVSDNIRVKSIIGRFLEHSRILCFGNGSPLPSPEAKVYISSANWNTKNLDRRFDTLIPIENQTVKDQILNQIMVAYLKDVAQSWSLDEKGIYHPFGEIGKGFSAQEYFMKNPSLSGRGQGNHEGIPQLTLGEEEKELISLVLQ